MKKQEIKSPDLAPLESILSYSFQNHALLERALTHRSWAHEQVASGTEDHARRLHNETLEFLGDSVLGLIVADYLCTAYPDVTEGELSRMKHKLVSASTLAAASGRLRLGDFLRFGRGEEKSGGRRKGALLADVLEALTGAIFLDGGLAAATNFVRHALKDELQTVTPVGAAESDYKTMLQERLQAERRPAPRYSVIEATGPPHRRTFNVEVGWDCGSVCAQGRTIKAAEVAAAREALIMLKQEQPDQSEPDGSLDRE